MRQSVAFPNGSRSYDTTRLAVRFRGYDHCMKAPFFIGVQVLGRLQPAMAPAPQGCLLAAARTYERRRSGSYDLLASDF